MSPIEGLRDGLQNVESRKPRGKSAQHAADNNERFRHAEVGRDTESRDHSNNRCEQVDTETLRLAGSRFEEEHASSAGEAFDTLFAEILRALQHRCLTVETR